MPLFGHNISIYNIWGGRERRRADCFLMPVSQTPWGVPASQRKVRKKTLPWLECISDSNICQRGLLLAVYLHKVSMNFNFYFTNPISPLPQNIQPPLTISEQIHLTATFFQCWKSVINVYMGSPTHKGSENCCFNSNTTQRNKWIRKFKSSVGQNFTVNL